MPQSVDSCHHYCPESSRAPVLPPRIDLPLRADVSVWASLRETINGTIPDVLALP